MGKKVRFASYFSTAKYKARLSGAAFLRNSRKANEKTGFISRQAVFSSTEIILKEFSTCKNSGNIVTPSPS